LTPITKSRIRISNPARETGEINLGWEEIRMSRSDEDHLNLLSILHYVWAGFNVISLLMALFYIAMGFAMATGAIDDINQGVEEFEGLRQQPQMPPIFGWIMVMFGTIGLLIGSVFCFAEYKAGQYLKQRTNHTYCVVIAAIECCFMPLGTILGVFTLITLMKPDVKEMFGVEMAFEDIESPE